MHLRYVGMCIFWIPVSIFINTHGTAKVDLKDSEIGDKIMSIFDMRPAAIVKRFGLKKPIFLATASYGHFGRAPYTKEVELKYNGETSKEEIEFFGWEKLDYVDAIKKEFGL